MAVKSQSWRQGIELAGEWILTAVHFLQLWTWAHPSSLALEMPMHSLANYNDCPLFDVETSAQVPKDLDEQMSKQFNELMDSARYWEIENQEAAEHTSLGEALDHQRALRDGLLLWLQDEEWGPFGGDHSMVVGGFGRLLEALAEGVKVEFNSVVSEICYGKSVSETTSPDPTSKERVTVRTTSGATYHAAAVLVTIPLGCLKAGDVRFVPELPEPKLSAINQLGYGVLNKVIMEFPEQFWEATGLANFFGLLSSTEEARGYGFLVWNLSRACQKPILTFVIAGAAAITAEQQKNSEVVSAIMTKLRTVFGNETVPEPTAFTVTRWGQDAYARGAYSYVAVGSSGRDYDVLAQPVMDTLFFAGEATHKEHPDTVGGAMLSGLREARLIMAILEGRSTEGLGVRFASKRRPYARMQKLLDAAKDPSASDTPTELAAKAAINSTQNQDEELSAFQQQYENATDPEEQAAVLRQSMLLLKSAPARCELVAKLSELSPDMLHQAAPPLEVHAVLPGWMQDSVEVGGKVGTELMRNCMELLLSTPTDMAMLRTSGVAKVIRELGEKHSSREVRSLRVQLAKKWFELVRQSHRTTSKNSAPTAKSQSDAAQRDKHKVKALHSKPAPVCEDEPGAVATTGGRVSGGFERNNNNIASLLPLSVEQEPSEAELAAMQAAEAAEARAIDAAKRASELMATFPSNAPRIMSFDEFDEHRSKKRLRGAESANASQPLRSILKKQSSPDVRIMPSAAATHEAELARTLHMDAVIPKVPAVVGEVSEELSHFSAKKGSKAQSAYHNELAKHKAAVADFLRTLLKPAYASNAIDRNAFKEIMVKAVGKIMERFPDEKSYIPQRDFLNDRRKQKAREMMDKYIEKYSSS
eukprot:jgi/Chlat1/6063/Chrsp4S09088